MHDLIGRTPYEIVEADRRFHALLWSLSPLRIVAHETARTWGLIQPYRSFMGYGPDVVARMHSEHETIVAGLEERDLGAYADAVESHQRHIYEVIRELAERESGEVPAEDLRAGTSGGPSRT